MNIDGFLGERNTVNIRKIPDNALSASQNVDIDDAGVLNKRNGYTKVLDLDNCTSGYSTEDQRTFIIDDGVLYRIDSNLNKIPIADCTADQFCQMGLDVITNDGLRIHNDTAINLRVPIPNQPRVSVINGNLPAGEYRVFSTFYGDVEGGNSDFIIVTLTENQGIRIFADTQSDYQSYIYVTDTNGTEAYFVGEEQADFINRYQLSAPFQMALINANSFPTTEILEFHESRLYCSEWIPAENKTVVRYSKAYYVHLFDYDADYFMLEGKVLAMRSTPQGLLIGTDTAIYAWSDSLQKVADYGVVPGRPFAKRSDGTVMIHSKRGTCVWPEFQNLTEAKVSLPPGSICSTAIVKQGGLEKFVVLSDGKGTAFNKAF